MMHAVMISAGVVLVLLVLLILLRGKAAARKPMGRSQVAAAVATAVLIAAAVDYRLAIHPAKKVAVPSGPPSGMGGGMRPGMGMMGGGPGGGAPGSAAMGGGGMGGGMMGGMGGAREPSPKRDLSRFVRKLALFQEKGPAALDPKQTAALLPTLTAMQKVEKMTEEEGKAQLEAVRALLTEAQLAAVDAIELPRPAGGMGMMGGGMGGGGMGGGGMGGGGMMGGGMGGPPPAAVAAGGAPGAEGPDRAQAFRERLLATPYVKQQYDAKVAEDSTFAQDETKQREFFGAVMRELSPFQQGSGKDALAALITALQDGGSRAAAPAAP